MTGLLLPFSEKISSENYPQPGGGGGGAFVGIGLTIARLANFYTTRMELTVAEGNLPGSYSSADRACWVAGMAVWLPAASWDS
jgi:hypothetical protein